jgi:hypothetical protein
MASNKFFQNAVVAAATLSVAVLAGCPTTPPGGVSPSGAASAKPSAPASPASPGAPTSPAPGSAAPATAAPTAIPSTPDTSSKATIHGVVFDDTLQRLSDVSVTGKVLGAGTFANGSDTLTTSTQVGSYSLNGAPTGQTILITVTKNGFTTRQKTIVPLANLQGDPSANKLDFGSDTQTGGVQNDAAFAMSDRPEVTTMTPKPDSTGVDPATTFTLTFSEPVNTSDVENNLVVGTSNDKYTLTSTDTLLQQYTPGTDEWTTAPAAPGATTAQLNPGSAVFTSANFTYAWSNNNQTVTATFRPGFKLPTDKDASKIPQFAVGFAGQVRDAAGSGTRADAFFRVSPAQLGKNAFRFTVAADTTAPKLVGVTAIANYTGTGKSQYRAQFSEIMQITCGSGAPAGGTLNIPATHNAKAAGNFKYDITQAHTTVTDFNGTAFDAASAVTYWDGDATNSTVSIVTKDNATDIIDTDADGAPDANQRVWLSVDASVTDPAGNGVETTNNANIKSTYSI